MWSYKVQIFKPLKTLFKLKQNQMTLRQQLNVLEAKQRRAGKSGKATRDRMLAVMKNQAVIINDDDDLKEDR